MSDNNHFGQQPGDNFEQERTPLEQNIEQGIDLILTEETDLDIKADLTDIILSAIDNPGEFRDLKNTLVDFANNEALRFNLTLRQIVHISTLAIFALRDKVIEESNQAKQFIQNFAELDAKFDVKRTDSAARKEYLNEEHIQDALRILSIKAKTNSQKIGNRAQHVDLQVYKSFTIEQLGLDTIYIDRMVSSVRTSSLAISFRDFIIEKGTLPKDEAKPLLYALSSLYQLRYAYQPYAEFYALIDDLFAGAIHQPKEFEYQVTIDTIYGGAGMFNGGVANLIDGEKAFDGFKYQVHSKVSKNLTKYLDKMPDLPETLIDIFIDVAGLQPSLIFDANDSDYLNQVYQLIVDLSRIEIETPDKSMLDSILDRYSRLAQELNRFRNNTTAYIASQNLMKRVDETQLLLEDISEDTLTMPKLGRLSNIRILTTDNPLHAEEFAKSVNDPASTRTFLQPGILPFVIKQGEGENEVIKFKTPEEVLELYRSSWDGLISAVKNSNVTVRFMPLQMQALGEERTVWHRSHQAILPEEKFGIGNRNHEDGILVDLNSIQSRNLAFFEAQINSDFFPIGTTLEAPYMSIESFPIKGVEDKEMIRMQISAAYDVAGVVLVPDPETIQIQGDTVKVTFMPIPIKMPGYILEPQHEHTYTRGSAWSNTKFLGASRPHRLDTKTHWMNRSRLAPSGIFNYAFEEGKINILQE